MLMMLSLQTTCVKQGAGNMIEKTEGHLSFRVRIKHLVIVEMMDDLNLIVYKILQ